MLLLHALAHLVQERLKNVANVILSNAIIMLWGNTILTFHAAFYLHTGNIFLTIFNVE